MAVRAMRSVIYRLQQGFHHHSNPSIVKQFSLFQSARLTYRAFHPSDFEEFYALWTDPRIQEGGSRMRIVLTGESMDEKFKTWSESSALWLAAADTETEEFIGWVSMTLDKVGGDASLGMLVKPSQWAKGYGTEMCA